MCIMANGLTPAWWWDISWTNADLLSVGQIGTNFSKIWMKTSSNKMQLKMWYPQWLQVCLGTNMFKSVTKFYAVIWGYNQEMRMLFLFQCTNPNIIFLKSEEKTENKYLINSYKVEKNHYPLHLCLLLSLHPVRVLTVHWIVTLTKHYNPMFLKSFPYQVSLTLPFRRPFYLTPKDPVLPWPCSLNDKMS